MGKSGVEKIGESLDVLAAKVNAPYNPDKSAREKNVFVFPPVAAQNEKVDAVVYDRNNEVFRVLDDGATQSKPTLKQPSLKRKRGDYETGLNHLTERLEESYCITLEKQGKELEDLREKMRDRRLWGNAMFAKVENNKLRVEQNQKNVEELASLVETLQEQLAIVYVILGGKIGKGSSLDFDLDVFLDRFVVFLQNKIKRTTNKTQRDRGQRLLGILTADEKTESV